LHGALCLLFFSQILLHPIATCCNVAHVNDLLTTREVQDLLKLDRTTVYRMLKEGRLTGVKVGQQWRFHRREVEALIQGASSAAADRPAPTIDPRTRSPLTPVPLPLHCVQAIQDVFADLARVGVITTTTDGAPLTQVSNGCRFCALVQATDAGRAACRASWRALAARSDRTPRIATCHAGLKYIHARIEIGEQPAAMLIAGQFRVDDAPLDTRRLAHDFGIDPGELDAALDEVTILDDRMRAQLGSWLQKVAHTFEEIGRERAAMIGRLRAISDLAVIDRSH
jgi:excisionase family DNA binding protein